MFNAFKNKLFNFGCNMIYQGIKMYFAENNRLVNSEKIAVSSIESPKKMPNCPFDLGYFSGDFGPVIRNEQLSNCKVLANRDLALSFMPKNAICAEIGVAYGDFSEKIINIMMPRELHLIDLYHVQAGDPEFWGMDLLKKSGLNHLQYIEAKFANYKNIFVRQGLSFEVLDTYPSDYFDYVYVDGGHDYNTVKKDINVLKRVVKNGGIIVFNDYTFFTLYESIEYGVFRAVNEFLSTGDHEVLFYCLQQFKMDDIVVKHVKS